MVGDVGWFKAGAKNMHRRKGHKKHQETDAAHAQPRRKALATVEDCAMKMAVVKFIAVSHGLILALIFNVSPRS